MSKAKVRVQDPPRPPDSFSKKEAVDAIRVVKARRKWRDKE